MYMQQWDLSVERQLGGNWLASASYMGNKATHFRSADEEDPAVYIPGNSTTANTNQQRLLHLINPSAGAYYSTITLMDDGDNTNYNALRLLRHSGEMTQVCSPKVTHYSPQKQGADAGYRYPAERVLPMGKWWRRCVS